uniref:F-box domain-containing protein n=1 Tax=Moniliophthora roreri TaxID=221103 RepID=A0A0W0EU48_MONRR
MYQVFPAEILHLILDNLLKSDLQACSLICRAWLPISQEHLFRSLRFVLHPKSSEREARVLLERFMLALGCLESRPDLLCCVHSFTLNLRQTRVEIRTDTRSHITRTVIASLPFKDLRHLDVRWESWFDDGNRHLPQLISDNPMLTSLALQGQKISCKEDLATFLGFHSPKLRTLCLNGTSPFTKQIQLKEIISSFKMQQGQGRTVPRLKRLSIGTVHVDIIRDIILDPSLYNIGHIEHVAFPSGWMFDESDPSRRARIAGSTPRFPVAERVAMHITSLVYNLERFNSASNFLLSVPAVHFPKLTHLQLLGVMKAEVLVSAFQTTVADSPNLANLFLQLCFDSTELSFIDQYLRDFLAERSTMLLTVDYQFPGVQATSNSNDLFPQINTLPHITLRIGGLEPWWGNNVEYDIPFILGSTIVCRYPARLR